MKKIIGILLIVYCSCLFGCGTQEELTPTDIAFQNTIVTYNSTQEETETILKDFTMTLDENYPFNNFYMVENDDAELFDIIVNEDGFVRAIDVVDPEVRTYKDIAVGDNISKMTDAFKHEFPFEDTVYSVLMNGDTEVDPRLQENEDSWLWINYKYENDIITKITIYDVQYGKKLR